MRAQDLKKENCFGRESGEHVIYFQMLERLKDMAKKDGTNLEMQRTKVHWQDVSYMLQL